MTKAKEYLITGGTGSLGRQLIRQLIASGEKVRGIRIYSRDELKQHNMKIEFKDSPIPIAYIIGDIRDYQRLTEVLKGVNYVFHTAALKQVPCSEENPLEFIQTNIYGTENVMRACIHCNVDKGIFISTDKSVEPINLYGATKMCAEKLWLRGSVYSGGHGTKFAAIRYGNVIGSRGSILDMVKQLPIDVKIPITDPRMTRFWIPLPKVANFILTVSDSAVSGNVYIPKMISCSLKTFMEAATDTTIRDWEIIGLRSGEKMHEMLVNQEESARTSTREDCYVVWPYGTPISRDGNPMERTQCGKLLRGGIADSPIVVSDTRNPLFTREVSKIKELLK